MYHNPQQSRLYKVFIDTMTGNKYRFTDVSYKNDTCDSIHSDKMDITIFFPNVDDLLAESSNEEDQLLFAIKVGDDDYLPNEYTLMEVVSLLNHYSLNNYTQPDLLTATKLGV